MIFIKIKLSFGHAYLNGLDLHTNGKILNLKNN